MKDPVNLGGSYLLTTKFVMQYLKERTYEKKLKEFVLKIKQLPLIKGGEKDEQLSLKFSF